MVPTLNDVQFDIRKQILRDYPGRDKQSLEHMMVCGLTEEAGEVAGIYKRKIRRFDRDQDRITDDELKKELGDVLWYLVGLCFACGFTLEEVYYLNKKKLEDRYGR